MTKPSLLSRPDGRKLAYSIRTPTIAGPGIVWLGGFKSDMTGTKATALDVHAVREGWGYTRFDYFGHGASSGDFRQGTISRWRDDALAVIDTLTSGPQILVGSSMGAWIAVLATLARPQRVAGLVAIAPATDFTEALVWSRLPDEARWDIQSRGEWLRPSAYDAEPYPITRALIEDGRKHLVLGGPISVHCPVRILHGMEDHDVPWTHALKLVERLESGDVVLQLVKHGDHRLSAPGDIERLIAAVEGLVSGA